MHKQIADSFTNVMAMMVQVDDQTAEARFLETNDTGLNRVDLEKFSGNMLALWKHLENGFYQYKKGFVEEKYWESACNYMRMLLRRAGKKRLWEKRKAVFAPEFIEFVDKLGVLEQLVELDVDDMNIPAGGDT